MGLPEETKNIIRELLNTFIENSDRWEECAKDSALRSIIGKAENAEDEKREAERYYLQATVWREAANIAKRLL